MKLKKIIYTLPLAALLFAVGTGCKKGQFNINQDINNPTDSTVTYDVVLPAALHASGVIVGNQWGPIQNWMGYWARSGTYAPNIIEETYQITTGFGNGIWNNGYDNNYDYQIVQSKAAVAGAGFYEGIARIMKAQNFQILVDVYGDIPYSQALKGSQNPTPAYDDDLAIYQDLFRQLDTAIKLIREAEITTTNSNKNITTNDIVMGVNRYPQGSLTLHDYTEQQKARWVRFANTLKLRMMIHAYAVPAINKTAEMAIINATLDTAGNGLAYGFVAAGDDVQVQPGYKSDKPNPFYNLYKSNTAGSQTANNVYYRANDWGIEYYKWDGDPRVSNALGSTWGNRLYEPGTGGLIGVEYGLPPVTENSSGILAGIGPGLYKSNDAPQVILTAGESFLLQAEARFRGWITSGPTAKTLMETGIVENMRYLGVPSYATAASTYITANASYPDVDYNGVAQGAGLPVGGLFTILSQKWFALNGINTLEVWTDYRRVPYSEVASKPGASTEHFVYGEGGGFVPGPPISVAPQNTSTKIPVRYLYPQTEYNYNAANVGAEGVINAFTSRIFWDLN
jgi:hypothetical protein